MLSLAQTHKQLSRINPTWRDQEKQKLSLVFCNSRRFVDRGRKLKEITHHFYNIPDHVKERYKLTKFEIKREKEREGDRSTVILHQIQCSY